MNDVPSVTDLVTRAMHGDEQAWDALVERYAPLVWSICRRYRLSDADAHDVSQSVWLGLVNHLGKLREPGALPGWLATTTRRECGKVRHEAQAAGNVLDTGNIPDEQARMAEQELLVAERHAALREAVTRLSPTCQRLIAILIEDPPVPYAQISARLGIPVGSIGPCRGRCLDKLRRSPAIAALIDADTDPAAGQGGRRVGRLPDDRVLRRMDRQPPRSSARPQSQ
jgi:RNA polymerase sigma factor (sigma-70 family)